MRRAAALLLLLLAAGVAAVLGTTGCAAAFGARPDPERMAALARTSRHEDGRFRNVEPREHESPGAGVLLDFFFGTERRRPPAALPTVDPRAAWATPPPTGLRVTWLGHSTLLVEMGGRRVLTDPMWSERASPSTAVGPRRFHPPPVPLESLPRLDAVVISHDHYDHLDMASVQRLARLDVPFFVPLGVADHLLAWGVPRERITELDWWGEARIGSDLTLVATPARHFSGRSLLDRDCTLWASWVIRTPEHRVFFSGDTGLTPQFEEIRDRQGPFDLVMLEVGAFHPDWSDIHLGPDNAVRALEMLGGGPLLPVHWGTFDLAVHAWDEPGERLAQLAGERGFPLLTPRPGSPIDVGADQVHEAWWRRLPRAPAPVTARGEGHGAF